jgi:hypothetical protein
LCSDCARATSIFAVSTGEMPSPSRVAAARARGRTPRDVGARCGEVARLQLEARAARGCERLLCRRALRDVAAPRGDGLEALDRALVRRACLLRAAARRWVSAATIEA